MFGRFLKIQSVGLLERASILVSFHHLVPTAYQLHLGRLLIKESDSRADKNIFVTSGNAAIQTTNQAVSQVAGATGKQSEHLRGLSSAPEGKISLYNRGPGFRQLRANHPWNTEKATFK